MWLPTVHQDIQDKLRYFHQHRKIPNIIFNGQEGSGKSSLVHEFLSLIYDGDEEQMKTWILWVKCAFGKGIKFIREELKFFAKMHMHSNGGDKFKSIVLFDADKLTMDAQSALRRCIELFSHNTRFFLLVEDKYKLLRPILSRFCEIYVGNPLPTVSNLYQYNAQCTFPHATHVLQPKRMQWLQKDMEKKAQPRYRRLLSSWYAVVTKWYDKAYCGLDMMHIVEHSHCFTATEEEKYDWLVFFSQVRKEIRNEKLLMFFLWQRIVSSSHATTTTTTTTTTSVPLSAK